MTLPVLFTPGPVKIPRSVADALSHPPVNYHRQDGFRAMFTETQGLLKALVGIKRPDDYFATITTSTGTGAVEGVLGAFAAHGKGLVVKNGFFAARWVDMCVQNGFAHAVLEQPEDRPIDPAAVDAALAKDPSLKWIFFVSHETRAGLKNPMVEVAQVAKKRGLFAGADIVSSAYAYKIDVEASGLDMAVTSSAKAIMGVPGLGITFVKLASLPALSTGKRPSYYADIIAETKKQQAEEQPRFAQPVALHAALHAAAKHLTKVGIDAHMGRIRKQMDTIAAHLATLGIQPMLDPAHRSWITVNFRLPPGIDYPTFARRAQEEGYYLLYGIPGDSTHFQVSTIGDLDDSHVAGINAAFTRIFSK